MKYDDIIDLPHHVSKVHPQMSRENRAAQFSPFAALTGYEEAVKEMGRLTDRRMILDEYKKEEIDRKLRVLKEHMDIKVSITWFVSDPFKEGGAYYQTEGVIEKWKDGCLHIQGEKISVRDIVEIGDVMENDE